MNLKPKKNLGQNFLYDNEILSKIIDVGNISSKDTVLEIGPGTGSLTEKILQKKPKKLYVVEKDKDLANELYRKFSKKVEIINEDILECYNQFNFNKPIKVFGNLPYNISSKILTSFIKINDLNKFFEIFIFVFQKELAERIIAYENLKEYGRLSVLVSWKMKTKKIIDISPDKFFPKPKVWSSLITLCPKNKIHNLKKTKNLEHITNVFFNQRRKMIKKPMKLLFKNYEEVAKKLDIKLNLRPQNISKDKFIEICRYYENLIQ